MLKDLIVSRGRVLAQQNVIAYLTLLEDPVDQGLRMNAHELASAENPASSTRSKIRGSSGSVSASPGH